MKKVMINQHYGGFKPGRIIDLDDQTAENVVNNGIGQIIEDSEPEMKVPKTDDPETGESDKKADEKGLSEDEQQVVE